jgi:hypothetical protein
LRGWPERLDAGRRVGKRIEHADEALDLLFSSVLGECQQLTMILLGKMGPEHQNARQVDLSGGDLLEEDRELSCNLGGASATEGGILGESKLVDTIGVEGRAGAFAMNAACVQFGQVREERGQELIGSSDEATSARVQVFVREMLE